MNGYVMAELLLLVDPSIAASCSLLVLDQPGCTPVDQPARAAGSLDTSSWFSSNTSLRYYYVALMFSDLPLAVPLGLRLEHHLLEIAIVVADSVCLRSLPAPCRPCTGNAIVVADSVCLRCHASRRVVPACWRC